MQVEVLKILKLMLLHKIRLPPFARDGLWMVNPLLPKSFRQLGVSGSNLNVAMQYYGD